MKIEITESGTEGREINKYGDKQPDPYKFPPLSTSRQGALLHQELWRKAEASRKVYELEENRLIEHFHGFKDEPEIEWEFEPGTIHEAELLENGKIKIIT